jgi:hypothetical protein
MKYDMKEMAKARLKKMQEAKGKLPAHHKSAHMAKSKYKGDDEYEMDADTEEMTPAPEEAPKHLRHQGHPGLGGDKGVAVMIGIGKPMPHGMPQKHPGLGESIEDEEPVMGGKYGK